MSVTKHHPLRAKATIICSRNDKILLVRRKGSKWKFPSGVLATGEAPIVAAARELWKALALHCSGLNPVGTVEVGNVLHHILRLTYQTVAASRLAEASSPVSGFVGRT